ncbi:MAG: class I tRNA ligase family protein, partial [Porphyromonadaceae bacterium]|nr:class I tRNA ligase family protein [Porphyromonadaceae bacterium]
TQDVEQFSFNTSVAAFMICINELQGLKTASREVLQPLLILLAPFAPHIAEELWHAIGEEPTIVAAQWPEYDEKLLVEDSFKYPVSFNGKTRFTIELPREASQDEIREAVLSADEAQKWLEGKTPKKVIIVPGRIINIVL